MEKLKNCPFCGGLAEVENGTDGAAIKCSKCGVSTEYYKDISAFFSPGGMGNINDFHIARKGTYGINQAVETWNKRV